MEKIIEIFSDITDVRDSKGKRHNLLHVVVIAVCAMLHGYNDFEDIHDYALANEEWFEEKLKLWNGIPCTKTMNNIFRLIPAEIFLKLFMRWINEIIGNQTGRQIILDGKGVRAAADKARNGNTPYIVSAYIADLGISISQKRVEDKSNEITAIPELIELLNIDGCIITIDAIGTQSEIMNLIKKNKGEFVLPLKGNQRGVYAEAEKYFSDMLDANDISEILRNPLYEYSIEYTNKMGELFEVYVHRENVHGRKTERIYIKSKNVSWLKDERFKHVTCLTKVITHTTIHDNSEKYFVSSISLPAVELGRIIRKHWQIENNLHWVLDMYFHEDLCRVSKDMALENMTLLRKLVYNIIKLDTRYDKVNKNGNLIKLSTKRKINRYNLYPEEFEQLLFFFLPTLSAKI